MPATLMLHHDQSARQPVTSAGVLYSIMPITGYCVPGPVRRFRCAVE